MNSLSLSTQLVTPRTNVYHARRKQRQQKSQIRKQAYKLKTELCRNIISLGYCEHGNECIFAHSRSEMKGVTLRERMKDGGIDLSTFRTRPCFDFISTGACPYGDRCPDIHDPQVSNEHVKSWLPCQQFKEGSNVDNGGILAHVNVHIDGCRETKRAVMHQGECFGPNTLEMMSSYTSFKDAVCNDSGIQRMSMKMPNSFLPFLIITKLMLDAHVRTTFPFIPSHVFYDRVCMILQEKYFYVPANLVRGGQQTAYTRVVEICNEADLPACKSPGYVVKATELAFGAPGSTNVSDRPAIWFDIPKKAIKKAVKTDTLKVFTARIKKTKKKQKAPSLCQLLAEKGKLHWSPFFTYYSDREDMRQLIVDMISMKIRELMVTTPNTWPGFLRSIPSAGDTLFCDSLLADSILEARFDAIKDEHLRYGWPVNEGRDLHNLDISVPPAESAYIIAETQGASPYSRFNFARKIYATFLSDFKTKMTTRDAPVSHIHMCNSNNSSLHIPMICSRRLEPLFASSFVDDWEKVKKAFMRGARE